jgi:hypothetical protein
MNNLAVHTQKWKLKHQVSLDHFKLSYWISRPSGYLENVLYIPCFVDKIINFSAIFLVMLTDKIYLGCKVIRTINQILI